MKHNRVVRLRYTAEDSMYSAEQTMGFVPQMSIAKNSPEESGISSVAKFINISAKP